MKRIPILLLTGSLRIGGTERNILHLATRLDPQRFEVEVWSDYEGEPIQALLRARGIPCRALKGAPSIGQPFLKRLLCCNLPYQWRLFRLLRRRRDTVIHAFGFPMIYYAVILGYLAGCRKIIYAVQDWDVWKRGCVYRMLDRLCSRLARQVIADGDGARRLAVSRQGMAVNRTITIYDGVNVEEIAPRKALEETRRSLGLDREAVAIGVIARLDIAKKGQDVFVRALRRVATAAPGARFVLIGDGPDRERIEAMVRELPEGVRPVLAGSRADLGDAIAALDVLAIPSRWESVPKILIEAMWLERAIVATRVGDIAEVLDETCGTLVEPDDPIALADAMTCLAKDAVLRRRLGRAAHARIVERGLTLDASIRRYETVYEQL